jgi:hypothetical protein
MSFITLLEPVHGSSTQVPLFMPRHLQTWYSHEDCFVCRHPDGCEVRVKQMKIVSVGVRRTGAIQFIKVLLLYGTPTNGQTISCI